MGIQGNSGESHRKKAFDLKFRHSSQFIAFWEENKHESEHYKAKTMPNQRQQHYKITFKRPDNDIVDIEVKIDTKSQFSGSFINHSS